MDPEELKKLDRIPTSDKPWYLQELFVGLWICILLLLLGILN